jgi:hypothetical protein
MGFFFFSMSNNHLILNQHQVCDCYWYQNILTINFYLEKRQRKPLAIVDPKSHEAIKVAAAPTQSNNTTAVDESATDSTPSSSKPTDDTNKSNTQEKFRKDFAAILNKNSQSDKVGQFFFTEIHSILFVIRISINNHRKMIKLMIVYNNPHLHLDQVQYQKHHPNRTQGLLFLKLSLKINQLKIQIPLNLNQLIQNHR